MGKKRYLPIKARIIIALVGALYIVLYGRLNEIQTALASKRFYIALTVSFLVALLIVNLVHYLWVWLDRHFAGTPNQISRYLTQMICGITIPLVLDFVSFAVYFSLFGENIFTNGFLTDDMVYVFCIVAAHNIFYLLLSLSQSSKAKLNVDAELSNETLATRASQDGQQLFVVDHKGMHLYLDHSDILYCYRQPRVSEIITKGKGNYTIKVPISDIIKRLHHSRFRQINRGAIINLAAIKGYVKGTKRNTLQLVVKKDFKPFFDGVQPEQLFVTKDYIDDFKTAFDIPQEEI